MKQIILILFLLFFLFSNASAVCNKGEICTITIHQARIESYDVENLKKFDFVVTNANGLGFNEFGSPKMFNVVSGVPIVLYDSFVEKANFDSPPFSDWAAVNPNNNWFLLDSLGNRINHPNSSYPFLYEMDVRNAAYQDYVAQRSKDLLDVHVPALGGNVQGLFFDQTFSYEQWTKSSVGVTASCAPNCPTMSQSEYENAVIAILQKIRQKIGSRLLTINGSYTGYTSNVDSQMWEGWMHAWWNPANQYYTQSEMLAQINYLADPIFANKSVFVGAGNPVTSDKMLNFAFSAYLIGKRNDSYAYFYYDDEQSQVHDDYFPELYDLDLGQATGNYYIQNNVYIRDYAKGKVLLNIENSASSSINLNGNFKKLDGTIVNSISLADHSGIILLNAGCDADNDGYNSVACNGNDCNDGNANIHPNASEICGNGVDEDCSNGDTACLSTCGNGIIDAGENCSNCSRDVSCSSSTICCNAVCSTANCSSDAQCNDNKPSTIDKCINPNSCNSYCDNSNNSVVNILCGNNRIDSGENCSTCASDVSCVAGRICSNGNCVLPECSINADCNDNNECTIDSCANNVCSHAPAPVCNNVQTMNIVVPLQAVEGERFVVTVVGNDKKPLIGVNVIYGMQAGFTDLFGRIEFNADKGFSEISASKIEYPSASASINIVEPEKIKPEQFFDLSALKDLASNPVVFLSLFGVMIGIGFFLMLLSTFKKPKKED